MDARARSSSTRLHTVVALTVFAFFSFLFMLVQDSEKRSIVRYDRRDVLLVARQGRPTSTGTSSSGVSATSTSISVSFEIASPSPSPRSSSISSSSLTSPSLMISTSIPSTTFSSVSSASSFTSVSRTHTASTISSSSQSAQTPTSSSVSTQKLLTASQTNVHSTESADRIPAITLAITNNPMPTFTPPYSEPASSSPALPSVTPVSAAATTSSFWHKKGAVAAIFVIVALVGLAIAAILVVTFFKRRSARREARLQDELFEKYTEPERRSPSPSASITAVPLDPFATPEVRYDIPPPFSNHAISQARPVVHSTSPVQHPDYYNQPPSRYLAPSQVQAARNAAPPSAFRNPDARDSYQPSIDSFYGAGQPSDFSA